MIKEGKLKKLTIEKMNYTNTDKRKTVWNDWEG